MISPEQCLGALLPALSDLADWLDKRNFPIAAEAVRDWHISRDGPWRQYAANLARLPELKGATAHAIMGRTLLRWPHIRLEKFFGR